MSAPATPLPSVGCRGVREPSAIARASACRSASRSPTWALIVLLPLAALALRAAGSWASAASGTSLTDAARARRACG